MTLALRTVLASFAIAGAVLAIRPAEARTSREVRVSTDAELRRALDELRAGDTVLLAPGEYAGGLTLAGLAGTAKAPIVIAGADRERPPVFASGSQALHLTRSKHVVLRDLLVRGQPANGINVDEGGPGKGEASHVTVERVRFETIGPKGNHDALKLSGLTDFTVRDCTFVGWGGSAVDMVGCARGLIVGCTFRGTEACSQHSGVQAKGGTSQVTIRDCRFVDAGQRAVNLGGSTGLAYFRPQDAGYEAKDLTVEGCRFSGSQAPVAFVGVDGATVRHNTFHRPARWLLRILQESRGERFVPCRNGRFEGNLIVFRRAELRSFVNVGPGTKADTFTFRANAWFATDGKLPEDHRPDLPVEETDGQYGKDPRLDGETLAQSAKSPCRAYGAESFERD